MLTVLLLVRGGWGRGYMLTPVPGADGADAGECGVLGRGCMLTPVLFSEGDAAGEWRLGEGMLTPAC